MKHVSLADARANIADLLDAVEQGETVQISPDGDKPATDDARREKAQEAMWQIMEARKTAPRVTAEEILQWRDEGRRY
jgi:antitoxin (DNA-binding transcriptional repressor) of toxin-antitoxin stability system